MNEDSLLARTPAFLVADGMGGHARGDAASQTAVHVLDEAIGEGTTPTADDVLAAVRRANTAVRQLSDVDDTGVAVAGTTLSGVVRVRTEADGEAWMVLNVGDSRVYDWDGRTLSQLSIDHSAVQELLDAGVIGAEDAAAHPDRNVITRALGAEDDVDVDVWILPAGSSRRFLVCSDGLCKELDDERIAHILADSPTETAADALVDAALEAGGRDNVSVIVVDSREGDDADDPNQTRDRAEPVREFLEDTRPRG
ncbi:protein phosphatase 2C domain-containing protein [Microbacterium sp. STN6]|uniref:PP2C family protein-serine/threonine phosphatase n=1 Tax=Microbacterium sp. STN6 TaxID=2995588 RepID=UPI002260CB63|nr:protein phosphatase 2C domain-containing protein [Microbacterium sp. STN6]MCX7522077.1 protein phosphatase 2C domain-containing protein [Microbacterium sp. STN6]